MNELTASAILVSALVAAFGASYYAGSFFARRRVAKEKPSEPVAANRSLNDLEVALGKFDPIVDAGFYAEFLKTFVENRAFFGKFLDWIRQQHIDCVTQMQRMSDLNAILRWQGQSTAWLKFFSYVDAVKQSVENAEKAAAAEREKQEQPKTDLT